MNVYLKAALTGLIMVNTLAGLTYCEPTIVHPAVQEYVPGQGNIMGNVDVAKFEAHGEAYAIGADENGYAVFKDPDAAFQAVKEDFADAIALIREEYGLKPFSKLSIRSYGVYGGQVTTAKTDEEFQRARFVGSVARIYESSYPDWNEVWYFWSEEMGAAEEEVTAALADF